MLLNKTFFTVLILFFCLSAAVPAQENAGEAVTETLPRERQWNAPLDRADLLLFSSHADDEHLFFAGILPYCAANGIKAQVVYMTNHNDNPVRNTELLNGLWAVGITHYPVISRFPDLYSESLAEALQVYGRRGFSEDDFIAYCVENIRRFKPQVLVGHDVNGEYGHGAHMLSSAALMKAVVLAADPGYHIESFSEYGVWDAPKTYINQWNERRIELSSIDVPLPFFNGKTAFQVSQYGFSYHKSQHWTFFYKWIYGTEKEPISSYAQIRNYPPGRYGLYRTLVGDDSQDAADFFQNVTLLKNAIEEPADEIDTAAYYEEPEIIENNRHLWFLMPIVIFVLAAASALLIFLKKLKRK